MTEPQEQKIQVGDLVRDRAQLGGKVIEISADRAKVEWNSGDTGWIRCKWLTPEGMVSDDAGGN